MPSSLLSTCVSGSALATGLTCSVLVGVVAAEVPDVVLAGCVLEVDVWLVEDGWLELDVWLGEDELDPPLKRLSINTVCPLGSNQARPLTASP